MPVRMLVFRFDPGVGRTNAGSIHNFKIDGVARNIKQGKLLFERFLIDAGGNHRAQDHVATGAGEAVEVKSLHK